MRPRLSVILAFLSTLFASLDAQPFQGQPWLSPSTPSPDHRNKPAITDHTTALALGLTYAGTSAGGYSLYRRPTDAALMVLVPSGTFIRGRQLGGRDESPHDAYPQRTIYLDSFLIDVSEVSVAQFRLFLTQLDRDQRQLLYETPASRSARTPRLGDDQLPMDSVSWPDASSYARFVHAALPTEAQWEKAARGTDGRLFPWGNQPSPGRLSFPDNPITNWVHYCYIFDNEQPCVCPLPIGSSLQSNSPYGVQDMASNVREWCSDWYGENYYSVSPERNPKGPPTGTEHVIRGGCCRHALYDNSIEFMTFVRAHEPQDTPDNPNYFQGPEYGLRLVIPLMDSDSPGTAP